MWVAIAAGSVLALCCTCAFATTVEQPGNDPLLDNLATVAEFLLELLL